MRVLDRIWKRFNICSTDLDVVHGNMESCHFIVEASDIFYFIVFENDGGRVKRYSSGVETDSSS